MKKEIENMELKELIQAIVDKIGPKFTEEKLETEKDFKQDLDFFDREYHTNIKDKIKEIPLLAEIFNSSIDNILETNAFLFSMLGVEAKIENELLKDLTKEQAKLLEDLQKHQNVISSEMVGQAFIYGYATAVELRDEAVKKYPNIKMSE